MLERESEAGKPNFMKKTLTVIMLAIVSLAFAGCTTEHKQVLRKTTIFGFQATTPELGYGAVNVQFGLIRSEYWSNPTSTNTVYAAPFNSAVKADLNVLTQHADETFGSK